jgi:glutamyl-tRNA(Gln) amidotransferase subunit D
MKTKNVHIGDNVKLQTKDKVWTGRIIQSYDQEITLLKLESGYNIGIRNNEIHDVEIIEKSAKEKKEKIKLPKNKELRNIGMIITTADDLFKIAPELTEICNITEIKTPFMKGSPDMSLKYWKDIAKEAHDLLTKEEIDGIIITHGTDTLHYGAASISFFIQNLNKPIAFTYSQRSIDRASTDSHLNLICAAKYATSDIAEVAIVGHKDLNDNECIAIQGTKARKMHTSRRDAFKSINAEPLATITKDHIKIHTTFNARHKKQPRLDTKYSDKVALIKVYPGQDVKILEYYQKEGYKGLVLEASGLGHLPSKDSESNWFPTIKKLVNKGMIICATPTTLYGSLNPNVYSYGRDLQKTGIIHLQDMLPETAFVKLSWIMGHKAWVYNDKSAGEKMLKNYANEINNSLKFE